MVASIGSVSLLVVPLIPLGCIVRPTALLSPMVMVMAPFSSVRKGIRFLIKRRVVQISSAWSTVAKGP